MRGTKHIHFSHLLASKIFNKKKKLFEHGHMSNDNAKNKQINKTIFLELKSTLLTKNRQKQKPYYMYIKL